MQNILFRFAERHNLTVGLPVQACAHQFCYPYPFSRRFLHPHTAHPHVIASHMRLNATELRRVMPPDTVYVTILREPAAMFESLFSYYSQHCASFKRVPNGSLEAFLDAPRLYYRPDDKSSMFAHNTLTFDLGGEKDRPATDGAYARGLVRDVERTFSLVMIAEHFDKSLVLLRHLLNWDLEDVLYVKLNMRSPGSRRSLGPDLPAKIRAWNSLDARLYDHFNATLWRRLEALGSACVEREVRLLRLARDRLVRGCFGGQLPLLRPSTQIENKELRPWQPSATVDIVGYDLPTNASRPGGLSQDECLKLILPEVQYSRRLLRIQSLRQRRSYPLHPPVPLRTSLTRHRLHSGSFRNVLDSGLAQRPAGPQTRARSVSRFSRRQLS